jgi:DNA-binding response OmpR family regulator
MISQMRNILLVEDNRDIQEANRYLLTRKGYNVRLAKNLAEARKRLAEAEPDIIVLHIMLPDGNGLDFLKELKQDTDIPVLLLTALRNPSDAVKGLRAGGDDYLPKPYDNAEFLARIEALLRRASHLPKTLVIGRLTLDLNSGMARIDGRDLLLTHTESALLHLLMQNEGKTVSSEDLYEKVWRLPTYNNQTLKKRISTLRKKLEDEIGDFEIENVRGKGYRLISLHRET